MRIFLLLNSLLPCLSLSLGAALPARWPEDHYQYSSYYYSSYDTEDTDSQTPEIVRPEENEED